MTTELVSIYLLSVGGHIMTLHLAFLVFSFALLPAFFIPVTNEGVRSYRSIGINGSKLIPEFDLKIHGVTLISGLGYAVLLFSNQLPMIKYAVAGAMVLMVFGLLDNLLGILTLRRTFRAEIQGGLAHMLISALFVAHLGNLLGTARFAVPVWLAVPVAIFSLLSILKVMVLLEKAAGKI